MDFWSSYEYIIHDQSEDLFSSEMIISLAPSIMFSIEPI